MNNIKSVVGWAAFGLFLVGLFFITQYALAVLGGWVVKTTPAMQTSAQEQTLLSGGTINTNGLEKLQ